MKKQNEKGSSIDFATLFTKLVSAYAASDWKGLHGKLVVYEEALRDIPIERLAECIDWTIKHDERFPSIARIREVWSQIKVDYDWDIAKQDAAEIERDHEAKRKALEAEWAKFQAATDPEIQRALADKARQILDKVGAAKLIASLPNAVKCLVLDLYHGRAAISPEAKITLDLRGVDPTKERTRAAFTEESKRAGGQRG